MDIRNFFGQRKQAAVASSLVETEKVVAVPETTTAKRKRIIEEEPDEEILESNVDSSGHVPAILTAAPQLDAIPVAVPQESLLKAPPREITDFITWNTGASVPYSAVVDTFDAVSRVSGRLDKENLFTKLFRAVIHSTPRGLTLADSFNACNYLSY